MIYLETSAAAKALIDENGSDAVRQAFADGIEFVSSRLLAVELHAVADRRAVSADAAQELIDRVALVSLTDDTLTRAVDMHSGLRTLDALHLATAIEIGDALTSILTFDLEFTAAATRLGIPASSRV
ncbi:type II toxin-antitoxin system VapC family toxin [Microbacterium sp. 22215]|uniref:type II toxin-antitoxin system VapC family toxin n=1 Tax=Microbacterium sp. 22215 TaxID=3453893 RepID=UPI003F841039